MSVPSEPSGWGLLPRSEAQQAVDLLFGTSAAHDTVSAAGEPEQGVGEAGEALGASDVLLADATEAIGPALEALLLMADEPMSVETLAEAVDAAADVVLDVLHELVRFYDDTRRGFELREVAGGWRYFTRAQHAELINAWVVSGQRSRLSQAALETLAVIAYTQPISRSRVSAVRGVNVDGVVRTLLARDLVAEVGHDDVTGAVLLGTTDHFLELLGLARLDDLPPIAPLLPDAAELEEELAGLVRAVEGPADDAAEALGETPRDGSEPGQGN